MKFYAATDWVKSRQDERGVQRATQKASDLLWRTAARIRPLCALVLLWVPAFPARQNTPLTQFSDVDAAISEAVSTGLVPGAVLVIGHNGEIVYRNAYGSRSLIPRREPMTLDTIFDAASLTKVVATTPSLMRLFEEGKLRIDDPVTKYLPEFQYGKSDITVRLLMTHFSGMPPDLELVPRWSGYETGIERALHTKPIAPPGARFIYSDINFILLGEIVHRLSGETLAQFAHDEVFERLGMNETEFLPPASLKPRIAPTEIDPDNGLPLLGVVHDPTSRYMGGIAGHAGLFTTADDLAKYVEMWLAGGEANSERVFSPLTIKKFTEPGSPADQPILRGLGWDIDSPFSSNRGELFPIGSFGHTGYTGTSIWMDPTTNSFVILLTNVVHPHHGNSLSSLRCRVATAVAAHYAIETANTVSLTGYNETISGAGVHRIIDRNAETQSGLDVLEEDGFRELRGKRIGLITNQTGRDQQGRRDVDVMVGAGLTITSLFSPEHGIAGTANEDVGNARDQKTGLPIISLYGRERRPASEQLRNVDALVFDIQDVGSRFYTYSCTLLYSLEEAARAKKSFFVLDRPNPITGVHVEGPTMEKNLESFVGCYDMPLRHGMTFGELATMANAEQHWRANLHVIAMKNWDRGDWFDSTDLPWIDPSPNMRSLNAALLYPGVAMLEYLPNYSVGRGTDAPFEQIGADWIDGRKLAAFLNARLIPGIRVYPTTFRPSSSVFAGQQIQGVRFVLTNREVFDSTRFGIELGTALAKLFPGRINFQTCRALIGDSKTVEQLQSGADASTIWADSQKEAAEFAIRRQPYLLYGSSTVR